jgi:hypothetical protein
LDTPLHISLSSFGSLLLSDGDNYVVQIPATVGGLIYFKDILISRQLGQTKLGQAGAPTQDQVDEAVSKFLKQRETNPFLEIDSKGLDI